MTLPASGAISFNAINVELCRAGGAQLSLNDSAVRTLFGQASGAVCMNTGHGKSNTSVPGVPTSVSASATSSSAISVSFSAPASNGGLTIDYYQVVCTSSGSNSATGASSPISVSGLSASTSYTFKVRAHNSKGYGCYSGTASATTQAPPYMSVSTTGATVYTCGNYKFALWTGTGSFIVNALGTTTGYGNHINVFLMGGGTGGTGAAGGGASGAWARNNRCLSVCRGTCILNTGAIVRSGYTYNVYVAGGGTGGAAGGDGGSGPATYIPDTSTNCGYLRVSTNLFGSTATSGSTCGYTTYYGHCRSKGVSNALWTGGTYYTCNAKCHSLNSGGGGAGAFAGPDGIGNGAGQAGNQYRAGNGGQPLQAIYCCHFGSIWSNLTSAIGGGGGGAYCDYQTGYVGQAAGGQGGGASAGIGAIHRNPDAFGINRGAGSASSYTGSGGGSGTYYSSGGNGGSGFAIIRWRFQ